MSDEITERKRALGEEVTWKDVILSGIEHFETRGTDGQKEVLRFGPGLRKQEWVSRGLGKQWNAMMDEIDELKREIKIRDRLLEQLKPKEIPDGDGTEAKG